MFVPVLLAAGAMPQDPPPAPPAAAATTAATIVAAAATQPQLAATADGSFHVVFLRSGNVAFATSTDRGKTFSPPVTAIDAKGNARGGLQRGPRIAIDGSNTIYVTAPLCFDAEELGKRYPTNDLYLAVSTDGGKSFTPPARVNDAEKQAPESLHCLAATAAGEVFVAWLDRRLRTDRGQDLGFTRITEGGGKVQKNLVLPGPLCECCAPGLATDRAGKVVLAWRAGGDPKNRALWIATSTDRGVSFGAARRLNHADSRVDG